MSYINCYNDNYYTPGENLSELFQELVVKPFESPNPLTQAWIDHVRNRDFKYRRETILEQGRTNFDEPFEGLTPKEKVLIYCLHYMPMHLFSSYHIFTKYFPFVNDKVVFVDFGCGPLTSGIAFWAAFAGHRDITYFGIDSSASMRHKSQEINRYGPYRDEPFFTKGWFISDYNRLDHYLNDYITTGDQTQIIFNFCYFLASKTLDVENLFNTLIQIVERYNLHKLSVIYQNPPIPKGYSLQSSYLHKNWYFLKTNFSAFHSQITQSNTEQFRYDSLIDGLPHTLPFYFDILSYEPSVVSSDPFELPPIF